MVRYGVVRYGVVGSSVVGSGGTKLSVNEVQLGTVELRGLVRYVLCGWLWRKVVCDANYAKQRQG